MRGTVGLTWQDDESGFCFFGRGLFAWGGFGWLGGCLCFGGGLGGGIFALGNQVFEGFFFGDELLDGHAAGIGGTAGRQFDAVFAQEGV